MTTLREAAQQALEALLTYEQYIQPLTDYFGGPRVPEEGSASAKVDAAITALRAALAEPLTNQCGETCERAKLCAVCARGLAEPVQEPVAFAHINGTSDTKWHPPQRKPLTEEEIYSLFRTVASPVMFARAIERVHNIKE